MIKPNLGLFDRFFRLIVGCSLGVLGFLILAMPWGSVVGLIGLAHLATGFVGWCPVYAPLKVTTRF
ncbi:MAG: DUF2892 domain-containing protein [Chloroflexota bacterium]